MRDRSFSDYLLKMVFAMWPPPDWIQDSVRFRMLFMTALVMAGPIDLISDSMASFKSVRAVGFLQWILSFKYLYKKNFSGERSGDLTGHLTSPNLEMSCPGNWLLRMAMSKSLRTLSCGFQKILIYHLKIDFYRYIF